jgi:hypothetical protein
MRKKFIEIESKCCSCGLIIMRQINDKCFFEICPNCKTALTSNNIKNMKEK